MRRPTRGSRPCSFTAPRSARSRTCGSISRACRTRSFRAASAGMPTISRRRSRKLSRRRARWPVPAVSPGEAAGPPGGRRRPPPRSPLAPRQRAPPRLRAAGRRVFSGPGLSLRGGVGDGRGDGRPACDDGPLPPPRLFDTKTKIVTASVVLGAPVVGYFAWWRTSSRSSFEFANERWSQRDTYAGGADKASHIFLGYISTLTLQGIYRSLGKTPAEARGLALGVTVVTGLLIEAGDGFSQYGFSWEDETANAIGALLGTGIDAWGLHDTVGLRFGRVKTLIPDACCRYGGYGDDYSKEVYSADLKLSGFLPRLGLEPGPARFLLLSMTYGSKGYRYSAAPVRERNVGVEIGLNLREVLLAAGAAE